MKYNQAIIYKLCCNDTDVKDIYVGSTTNFKHRKYHHKSSCNNSNNVKYNFNVYKFIRDNGGWDNWSMIQIEQYEAKDKRDLEQKERYYLELLKATLNRQLPTRTHKESAKAYRDTNKETIAIKSKEYRNNNKEKPKDYLKKNKEKIKDRKSKKYMCDCGSTLTHGHRARHLNSKNHKEYLLNLINPQITSL